MGKTVEIKFDILRDEDLLLLKGGTASVGEEENKPSQCGDGAFLGCCIGNG